MSVPLVSSFVALKYLFLFQIMSLVIKFMVIGTKITIS